MGHHDSAGLAHRHENVARSSASAANIQSNQRLLSIARGNGEGRQESAGAGGDMDMDLVEMIHEHSMDSDAGSSSSGGYSPGGGSLGSYRSESQFGWFTAPLVYICRMLLVFSNVSS